MDSCSILDILPQRPPFLFIDKVVRTDAKKGVAVCSRKMSPDEYFFQGHFPGNPVVPGVILVEAMAQASIILYAVMKPGLARKKPTYYLGKVEARFLKPVLPGSTIVLEARKDKILDTLGLVNAVAKVKGQKVAEATLAFGVKLPQENT